VPARAPAAGGLDGDGGDGALDQGTEAPEADVDYDVTDLDPASLCFDASALPESFVSDGEIPLDNATAAEVYADYSPELEAEIAAQYETWGRLSGHESAWAFAAPSALTKEDEQTLPEEELSARGGQRVGQAYFGHGVIGDIHQDRDRSDHRYAEVWGGKTPSVSARYSLG
jgi:hypothetical protein